MRLAAAAGVLVLVGLALASPGLADRLRPGTIEAALLAARRNLSADARGRSRSLVLAACWSRDLLGEDDPVERAQQQDNGERYRVRLSEVTALEVELAPNPQAWDRTYTRIDLVRTDSGERRSLLGLAPRRPRFKYDAMDNWYASPDLLLLRLLFGRELRWSGATGRRGVLTLLHEIGHSNDERFLHAARRELRREPAATAALPEAEQRIVLATERRAWADAVLSLRRLRREGFDPLPGVDRKTLFDAIYQALRPYYAHPYGWNAREMNEAIQREARAVE